MTIDYEESQYLNLVRLILSTATTPPPTTTSTVTHQSTTTSPLPSTTDTQPPFTTQPPSTTDTQPPFTTDTQPPSTTDTQPPSPPAPQYRNDRTNTGTISIFAPTPLRFNLSNNSLPLLTTKTVPLRLVFEELMWFIRGNTDSLLLSNAGVGIWDDNASRQFLDSRGLAHHRVGDLGPVYGFQWRHFGAQYRGVEGDIDKTTNIPISYKNQGVDQLYTIIDQIVNNPTDRRIILSAWNPSDLDNMALPPCHILSQFYVSTSTLPHKLSCQLYQRSADVGLGVPFNIASYSLLLILLSHVTGCVPGEFVHVMGDAHVYGGHEAALGEQCLRMVRAPPQLFVGGRGGGSGSVRSETAEIGETAETNKGKVKARSVQEMLDQLEAFQWSDLELVGYKPHGKLTMKMAI